MTDTKIRWTTSSFDQLDTAAFYQVMQLRQQVFVVEQDCVYQDLDGLDQEGIHLCGWSGSVLHAYLRALPPGVDNRQSSLGRIVVAPAARGMSLGREVVRRGIELSRERWPADDLRIGAQAHLQEFYSEFGFTPDSEIYDEDGIPHVKMLLRFNP